MNNGFPTELPYRLKPKVGGGEPLPLRYLFPVNPHFTIYPFKFMTNSICTSFMMANTMVSLQ